MYGAVTARAQHGHSANLGGQHAPRVHPDRDLVREPERLFRRFDKLEVVVIDRDLAAGERLDDVRVLRAVHLRCASIAIGGEPEPGLVR